MKIWHLVGVIGLICSSFLHLSAQKPAENYPENLSSTPPLSLIQVPIKVAQSTIQTQLNQKMQGLLYEVADLEGAEGVRIQIWKRSDIILKGEKNTLLSEIPLRIEVNGDYKTSVFGVEVTKRVDQSLRMNVYLRSTFSLDKDWKLQTKTELVRYEWIDKPSLTFGFLKISIASWVDEEIEKQKGKFMRQADEMVARYIDIKTPILQAWRTFQTPFEVWNWTGDKIWIACQPQLLQVSPSIFEKDTLITQVQLTALANGTIADQMPRFNLQKLPEKKEINLNPPSFSFQILGRTSKELAIRKAKEIFTKKSYSFREGKYTIQIQDLSLYGSSGRMVIQLQTKGSVEGTVYLIGTPVWNTKAQKLELENFDYVMNAQTSISKVVRWLFAAKIKNEIRKTIEEEINSQIYKIRLEIEKNLKRFEMDKNTILKGKIARLELQNLALSPTEMIAQILVSGEFEIEVVGF